MKLGFSRLIFENYSNIKFHELHPVGAEFHTDGHTDMTKPIVGFRNFGNAPKNE
jgi:hypothetical protein